MSQPGFPVSAPSNIEADFSGLTARAVAVINALIASGDFIPAHTPDDTSISFVDNEQFQLGFPAAKIIFNEINGNGETIIGGQNGNETVININDATEIIDFQAAGVKINGADVMIAESVLRSYLATTVTYNADDTLGDTPLSVTVAAGGIYAIELVVHSTSAVKALNMDFGGTATIANFIGEWTVMAASGEDQVINGCQRNTSASADFAVVGGVEGVSAYYTFTGSVEITDAGTFLLRGAQNVSDASNTTILRGSTLTLTRLN